MHLDAPYIYLDGGNICVTYGINPFPLAGRFGLDIKVKMKTKLSCSAVESCRV